ncbi:MAG: fibronectin-binding protein (FBP) [Ignavibacteria bacterium]|jgi:hypothetical protein|nr:fibronectin-binding protein (FBP) [Ignavibacteria bacterium]
MDWTKKHLSKIGNKERSFDDFLPEFLCSDSENTAEPEVNAYLKLRQEIEPWLSAIFQSEHLSLLVGNGLTLGISQIAGVKPPEYKRPEFEIDKDKIREYADKTAKTMDRGEANFEDDLRTANLLLNGLNVLQKNDKAKILKSNIDTILEDLIKSIIYTERCFVNNLFSDELELHQKGIKALEILKSFFSSFASRVASRDRLNIFTTNYDRFIEFANDEAGILSLDRFRGTLYPIMRNTRLELDYHYNPPGIRGEPRYVEGVVRFTKIHGSIDWRFENHNIIKELLPFGADENHPIIKRLSECAVIYPNSSKAIETAFYPYSELFRDFSAAICKPNSTLVTYGYGFGDSHINQIINDMLTIPSTHVVIIAYDKISENGVSPIRDRIRKFFESNPSQITLLIGDHLGAIENLTEYYLPKPAIDRITEKAIRIKFGREPEDKLINNNTPQVNEH